MKASIKLQQTFTIDFLAMNPHIQIDDLVDYVEPEYFNPDTQNIGNIILVNGFATHEIINKSSEEIAQIEQEKRIAQAKEFIENNQKEGQNFYDEIHLRITVALFAVERNILFPILDEIDNKLYPPLNKIKTGDFASALYIFANQQAPTNEFVLDFYNEVVIFCKDYYDTKYPK